MMAAHSAYTISCVGFVGAPSGTQSKSRDLINDVVEHLNNGSRVDMEDYITDVSAELIATCSLLFVIYLLLTDSYFFNCCLYHR